MRANRFLRIALLGSRGIPARYSGFETFYEQLAVRLFRRGHEVTVYNRSHFINDIGNEYSGVKIVSLPSISTKHLDTISHTFLSSIHALFQHYDIVLDGITGILVKPSDVQGLAMAILNLTKDKKLRQIMGRNGYERQRKLFSVDRYVAEFSEIYDAMAVCG